METLIIIDGNSVVHRAYHALPELTAKGKGMVNAVYGFLLVFLKAIDDFNPNYIAVCFDTKPPTFRHKKFGEYKAGRKKAPQDLYDQIPLIKEILTAMDVAIFEKPGFEADDLIGTIASKAPHLSLRGAQQGDAAISSNAMKQEIAASGSTPPRNDRGSELIPEIQTIIVSSDFDVFQLANNNTKVYNLIKGVKQGEVFDAKSIKEKYGITPSQIVDFKALAGDASDNIPGATGIGKTTATHLIQEYESVEKLYKALEAGDAWDMKQRTKELLLVNKEQVLLSYELAKIDRAVDIDLDMKKCSWRAPSSSPQTLARVAQKLEEFQFYTLKNRL